MLFDTTLFVWFLLIVFFGFWLMVRYPVARVVWLLGASYVFYASWNPSLLLLILFSTALDYHAGRGIYRATRMEQRRAWLALSLVGNLGLLAVFKYADFVLESVNRVAAAAGAGGSIPLLDLVLPVGISFYTFQTLSYTLDIYRGRLKAVDNPLHFALFVAFFPQLVAGPIVRAADFLPQLLREPRYDARQHGVGLFLIAGGLIKKVAIANVLAVNLVDRVFDSPELYSSLEVLAAMHGYALQIYCDFSGYSDVAIGVALLLGFRLPENFRRPYMSANLADFWRRWHISLSSWLRDYLYVPLGGNRGTELGTYRNLFLTMLLGGLWHGASWTFVVWGALHGGALAVLRLWQRLEERAVRAVPRRPPSGWWVALSTLVTFEFVNLCWVFFRAPDFGTAFRVLGRLAEGSTYTPNLGWVVVSALLGGALLHVTPVRWKHWLSDRFVAQPAWVQATVMVAVAVWLQHVKGTDVVPFIYFQF